MNNLDFQLKLLKGSIIYIGNIPTYKVSLDKIIDFGYVKYQNILRLICMNKDEIKYFFSNKLGLELELETTFMFLFIMAIKDLREKKKILNDIDDEDFFIDDLLSFFMLIFNNDIKIDEEYGFVIGNKYFLNDKNFEELQDILKFRNCLNDIQEDDENPADEATRKLLEKRKKLREKIKKSKKTKSNEDITLFDLISIFAEMEKVKISDICEYDIFQFNNQFNRMKIVEDFKVNIQSLLAGVNSKDIEFQHWLSKTKKTND